MYIYRYIYPGVARARGWPAADPRRGRADSVPAQAGRAGLGQPPLRPVTSSAADSGRVGWGRWWCLILGLRDLERSVWITKRYFSSSNFVMARSLCGVPGLIHDGSAHSRTGSETAEDQGSKHMAAGMPRGVPQLKIEETRTEEQMSRRLIGGHGGPS